MTDPCRVPLAGLSAGRLARVRSTSDPFPIHPNSRLRPFFRNLPISIRLVLTRIIFGIIVLIMLILATVLLTTTPADWPISVPLTYALLAELIAETNALYGYLAVSMIRFLRAHR